MRKSLVRKGLHLLGSKFDAISLSKAEGTEKKVYQIISEIRQSRWSSEEEDSLKKIERLRTFYSTNSDEIFIEDFGAGSSTDNRTDEQMNRGTGKRGRVSEVYKSASSSPKEGKLVFKILRTYKPKNCFELGTCLGISAAYGIEALRLNATNGMYTTFEGSSENVKWAQSSLERFSFTDFKIVEGRFQDTLPTSLKNNDDIDFVFIDGHHDEKATVNYFELFYPNLSQKAIIVFDDINWSKGMRRAWKTIKKDHRIAWTVSNYFRGICYIDKQSKVKKRDYRVWF
jgi:predicted O-methyltransferase YrrM